MVSFFDCFFEEESALELLVVVVAELLLLLLLLLLLEVDDETSKADEDWNEFGANGRKMGFGSSGRFGHRIEISFSRFWR